MEKREEEEKLPRQLLHSNKIDFTFSSSVRKSRSWILRYVLKCEYEKAPLADGRRTGEKGSRRTAADKEQQQKKVARREEKLTSTKREILHLIRKHCTQVCLPAPSHM